jgi:DNA-directed RNA polymerase specialized sigma24 family protein
MSRGSANRLDKNRSEENELATLQRVARLLEILVRLTLQGMKDARGQPGLISMLDEVGCGPSEIADLLSANTNTVNVSLYRAKRRAGKK